MKRFCLFLCICILFSGCSTISEYEPTTQAQTATSSTAESDSIASTTQITQSTTTQPIDPVEQLLEQMTLEERVGQLFLVAPPENPVDTITKDHLGGYILFDSDFNGKTPDSVKRTIAEYQQASAIPMLIAVDEEGGSVCRVSTYPSFRSSRFPSPRSLFDEGGLTLLLQTESEKSKLLHGLGINVNMAPVCDITTDPEAFMYSRSLGQSAEITAQCIASIVETMGVYHVGSVLKHFPGYGNNTDTHVAMAVDTRTLTQLEASDLIPFQAGMDAGCGAVLVSHTIVNAIDADHPATLSPAVHDYLRNTMGFDGVIMTDDLEMDAISDHYGQGEAAVLAILAGNDIICSWTYEIQYAAVLEAVNTGRISMEQLNSAVLRILRWKQQLGLLSKPVGN